MAILVLTELVRVDIVLRDKIRVRLVMALILVLTLVEVVIADVSLV